MDNSLREKAEKTITEKYGFQGQVVQCFGGYEDLNFLINRSEDDRKYVMKIINESDSEKPGLIEAVADVIMSVQRRCSSSSVVETLEGETTTLIPDGSKLRKVVLLSYVDGKGISHWQRECLDMTSFSDLCTNVGVFVGDLCAQLKTIRDFAMVLQRHDMGCKLENIISVRDKLGVVKNDITRDICSEAIARVHKLSASDEYFHMTKGIIHGDLTLENLLFEEYAPCRYRVNGVIDFMDASHSCYIFDIANMLCSVMHTAVFVGKLEPFEAARVTLAAIRRRFKLNSVDQEALYDSVMGRLCILLVFCGYDMAKSEQTLEHFSFDLAVIEDILNQTWTIGALEWKQRVIQN